MALAYSRNGTVLVVEDDAALRELYRTALRSAGYAVIAVEDGLDALRRLDHQAPDAIVLDLSLPRVDGRDVSHELKAHRDTRHIPVIVVSGTDMRDLDPKDFAGILRKPIRPEVLILAVERCLRESGRPARAV